jgi:hypothetical protein
MLIPVPSYIQLLPKGTPVHCLCTCATYQELWQKLWNQPISDTDVAAKVQVPMAKSEEEKVHSRLDEMFWGAEVDED